jgi:hypothetical protein
MLAIAEDGARGSTPTMAIRDVDQKQSSSGESLVVQSAPGGRRVSIPRAAWSSAMSSPCRAPDGGDRTFEEAHQGERVVRAERGQMDLRVRAPHAASLASMSTTRPRTSRSTSLPFAASGFAQGRGGQAVQVAERAVGGLVKHGQCVRGEELAVASGLAQTQPHVLGRVLGGERADGQAPVDSGEEASGCAGA